MTIKNVTFRQGYLEVTEDGGRKRGYPVFIKLAQVVMALIRLLMEYEMLQDETLESARTDIEGVTLQSLLDTLTDYYGAEYENESAVTKG